VLKAPLNSNQPHNIAALKNCQSCVACYIAEFDWSSN